jgi:hypothetical protein
MSPVYYKRIWSETVPVERWQKILKMAKTKCPSDGKEFCAEIIRAGKATTNNQVACPAMQQAIVAAPAVSSEPSFFRRFSVVAGLQIHPVGRRLSKHLAEKDSQLSCNWP